MRIHLIAIGGKVMHNLALELHALGHNVTGSDDEIYEPARSRLAAQGLLPRATGWNEAIVTSDIDVIILGMHAHADNPELLKAQELRLRIESFPSYIYEAYRQKKRVVITGSHGKTTTTAMIVHALTANKVDIDFLVGGDLPGLDRMVRISDSAPIAIIEGDEYLSSRIHRAPKMHYYRGNIIVLTGIEWDHMNVFPTYVDYVDQFRILLRNMSADDILIYYQDDSEVRQLVSEFDHFKKLGYSALSTEKDAVLYDSKVYPVQVFGQHNFANMHAALLVCELLNSSPEHFLLSMQSFNGVGRRLELVRNNNPRIYLDYAHAPSKVRATVKAVRSNHLKDRMLAVYELHTYSSMNVDFLPYYQDTMSEADEVIIYLDDHALQMKRMPAVEDNVITQAFGAARPITVIRNVNMLSQVLKVKQSMFSVILMMSSGTFSGLALNDIQ